MREEEYQYKKDTPAPRSIGWLATYSDMVTLLLTFFVLLLSFAKTETSKYEAALGSIRNAFGGNVLKQGRVIQTGKSPEDSPTMLESREPVKPFPINFLTTEGFLNKLEINRESSENLKSMRKDLRQFNLSELVDLYEMPEGIKVKVQDKIYFKEGDIVPKESGVSIVVYERIVKLMKNSDWVLIVQGYASQGEEYIDSRDQRHDAFALSGLRAQAVVQSLLARGVPFERVTTVFYGDSRYVSKKHEDSTDKGRWVDFIIRKEDVNAVGNSVSPR